MNRDFEFWKLECGNSYTALKNNEWLGKIFGYLSEFDITLGTNSTYYYYDNEYKIIDTRRLLYYKNVGIFKIIIKCDTISNSCTIWTELIRRTELRREKIQDIYSLLDDEWRNISINSPYIISQEYGFNKFKEDFQKLIKCLDDYFNLKELVQSKEDLKLLAIEIYNFKSIKEARIDFEYPLQVLVGENNAGKTSLIQGILTAYRALYRLMIEKKIKFDKNGFMTSDKENIEGVRLENIPFIINNFRELFNIEVQPSEYNKGVKFVKFEFQNNAYIELDMRIVGEYFSIRLKNCSNGIYRNKITKFIEKSVTLIPTFFTVTLNEERKYQGRYNSLMKSGNYNMLFRNILIDLKNKSYSENDEELELEKSTNEKVEKNNITEDKFQILKENLERIFNIKNLNVEFDEQVDEYISATYEVKDRNGRFNTLDISTLGMGTLQFIQVVAQALIEEPFLILLDEPDAHLNAKLQKVVIQFFDLIAEKYKVNLLIATHSKDIINCVSPNQVFSLKEGRTSRIGQANNNIIDLFKTVGATTEELVGIGIGKRIVMVEGCDDIKYIKKLCEKEGIDKDKFYSMINFVDFDGRTGVLTNRLEKYIPDEWNNIKKLAVFDKDYRFQCEQKNESEKLKKRGFEVVEWKKKEFENYFIVDSLLIRVLKEEYNVEIDVNIINDIIENYFNQMEETIKIEFEKELKLKKVQEIKNNNGIKFKDIDLNKNDEVEIRKEVKNYIENSSRRDILSGKELLDEIRINTIKVGTPDRESFMLNLISYIDENEIHEDIKDLLNKVKNIAIQ